MFRQKPLRLTSCFCKKQFSVFSMFSSVVSGPGFDSMLPACMIICVSTTHSKTQFTFSRPVLSQSEFTKCCRSTRSSCHERTHHPDEAATNGTKIQNHRWHCVEGQRFPQHNKKYGPKRLQTTKIVENSTELANHV